MNRQSVKCMVFRHIDENINKTLRKYSNTYLKVTTKRKHRPNQQETTTREKIRLSECYRLNLFFAYVFLMYCATILGSTIHSFFIPTKYIIKSLAYLPGVGAFQTNTIIQFQSVQQRRRQQQPEIVYSLTTTTTCTKRPLRNIVTTTSLNVLTVPIEKIIEEASTTVPTFFIDDLIDESVRTTARKPVIAQLTGSDTFFGRADDDWSLWKRWKGTVFAQTWQSCLYKMLYSAITYFVLCHIFGPPVPPPPATSSFISVMSRPTITSTPLFSGFNVIYGQVMLPITTFTLTFFVDQAYKTWRKCLSLSRQLQGRIHDLNLLLASHAARMTIPTVNDNNTPIIILNNNNNNTDYVSVDAIGHHYRHHHSTYTDGSRQILELVSRYVRIFNLFAYASFTRSHRPIVTPRGMRRLVERGLLTEQEREILITSEVPATQFQTAVLLWIFRLYIEGCQAGHFQASSKLRTNSSITDPSAIEQQFMQLIYDSRVSCGAIGSTLNGRMPLAYTHIVQVLVDIILWSYPILAYSSGMSGFLCVVGTGLLTIGYRGLFDLSKRFLDPYDNENFGKGEDPFSVDTFIAETNAGSVRWMNGLDKFPISTQSIQDGKLADHLLPLCGYSIEEESEMEFNFF